MRHMLLDAANTVINLIALDPADLNNPAGPNGGWSPPAGQSVVASDNAYIGDTYDAATRNLTRIVSVGGVPTPTIIPNVVPTPVIKGV